MLLGHHKIGLQIDKFLLQLAELGGNVWNTFWFFLNSSIFKSHRIGVLPCMKLKMINCLHFPPIYWQQCDKHTNFNKTWDILLTVTKCILLQKSEKHVLAFGENMQYWIMMRQITFWVFSKWKIWWAFFSLPMRKNVSGDCRALWALESSRKVWCFPHWIGWKCCISILFADLKLQC